MNYQKLFSDYRINYSTKVNRGWINVACPHCDDKTFNGGFNVAGDYFHCWKCGGHPFKKTLSLVLSVPFSLIDEIINSYPDSINSNFSKKVPKVLKLELPTDNFTAGEKKYLEKRDFDSNFLHKKYGVVGGGVAGRWKYRIIIPLLYNGRLVSWTGRSILSKSLLEETKIPRYKNLSVEESVVDPKSIFFNLDNAKKDVCVLVEGVFDVMRLGDGFICSFGTELTQKQIWLISQKFNKVFVMFDSEKRAQEKAKKCGLMMASLGLNVEVVDAYGDFGKNDGGELNEKEVKLIRKELCL